MKDDDLKVVFGGLMGLAAMGVLGYQFYVWLRTGSWMPISALDSLVYLSGPNSSFQAWAVFGGDWEGLRKILMFLPLSGTLFGIGFVPLLFN